MPTLKVKVTGLSRAGQIPGWIEDGQRRTLELAVERLVESIRLKAPGPKIAAEAVGRTLSSKRGEIVIGTIGRAFEKGAYRRSNRGPGTAVRFNAGGDRFVRYPRGTRLTATKWVTKGLRPRRRIFQEAFDDAMGHLG